MKRKRYTDNFRAKAVSMLAKAGYPQRKGALTQVSNSINVPLATIHGWFHAKHNPPPEGLIIDDVKDQIEKNGQNGKDVNTWDGVPRGKLDGKSRYIYLIREGFRGLVKIGIASDIYARIASMQAGCPQELSLIGFIKTKNARSVESNIHYRYFDQCYRGEWFELSDSDIQTILDFNNGTFVFGEKGSIENADSLKQLSYLKNG
jgi:hypothetical protein